MNVKISIENNYNPSTNPFFRIRDSAYTSFKRFLRFLRKIFKKKEVKVLNNFVKNKDIIIQKVDKGNNVVILNSSDYVSQLSKILEEISKIKKVNVEERKALNHSIYIEERIIRLFKSLEDQGEISEKE